MNLIEQLGGYEKAASLFNGCPWDSGTVDVPNPFSKGMLRLDLGELRSELLEYRRQHNIYEVLDLIMYENKLYEIKYIYHPEKARITDGLQGRTVYDFPNGIRHATDAEIAAGHRL